MVYGIRYTVHGYKVFGIGNTGQGERNMGWALEARKFGMTIDRGRNTETKRKISSAFGEKAIARTITFG